MAVQDTILSKVNTVLALDKDDPAKEDEVKSVSRTHRENPWGCKQRLPGSAAARQYRSQYTTAWHQLPDCTALRHAAHSVQTEKLNEEGG